jgi:hypothetical protein
MSDELRIRCNGDLDVTGGIEQCNRWLATLQRDGQLKIACPKCGGLHTVNIWRLLYWLYDNSEFEEWLWGDIEIDPE